MYNYIASNILLKSFLRIFSIHRCNRNSIYSRVTRYPELEFHQQMQLRIIPRKAFLPKARESYTCVGNTVRILKALLRKLSKYRDFN